MNIENSLTAYRINLIVEALHGRALTTDEIAPMINLCRDQTVRYMQLLHKSGAVYISAWPARTVGRATRLPAYRLGSRSDAPKPARMSGAERQAAYKARIFADVDRHERFKAVNVARRRKPVRDPLVAAMFGATAGTQFSKNGSMHE